MQNLKSLIMTAVASLLTGTAALASPRDTATFTNLNTDIGGTCGGANGSGSIPITADYTVHYLVLSGQFTRLVPGTCESEATIRIFDGAASQIVAIAPFSGCVGQTNFTNLVVKLPRPVTAAAASAWSVRTQETYNDSNAAADGRWDSLTITLDDGPPFWLFVADCGPVRAPGFSLTNQSIGANSVRWYKLSLPNPAKNLGIFGTWHLDIDTEGSSVSDMELALFDADGRLLATDDDSGSGNQARLSFGAGPARPAIGSGLPYDNSNGTLEVGTYYIAMGPFNATFGETSWIASTDVNASVTGRLNVRTNIDFSPFCQGDFNKDGSYNTLDIIEFLNSWFAGCP